MMLRLGIYFHVFFGLIFLLVFPPIGALMLCIGFVLILIAIGNRKADILDNWSILIKKAHGQGDKIVSVAINLITESEAPSIEMKEEKVGPSLAIVSLG